VAADDVADAGLSDEDGVWILRRLALEVTRWPRLRQDVEVVTWASGVGASVAERRTSVAHGDVEATALWVCVDRATLRPRRFSPRFLEVYHHVVGGQRVSSRLLHPDPPAGARSRRFPLRYSDLDRVGHVNNAAYLAALEDVLGGAGRPCLVEVEWRGGISRTGAVDLLDVDGAVWFVQDGKVAASIRYSGVVA
jgi:acyl-ACP thioesterase